MVDLYPYVPGFGMLEAIAEGLDGNAVNLAGKSRIQLTGNAYKLDLEYGRAIVSAIGCVTLSKGPYSGSAMSIALSSILLASAVRVGNRLEAA